LNDEIKIEIGELDSHSMDTIEFSMCTHHCLRVFRSLKSEPINSYS